MADIAFFMVIYPERAIKDQNNKTGIVQNIDIFLIAQ